MIRPLIFAASAIVCSISYASAVSAQSSPAPMASGAMGAASDAKPSAAPLGGKPTAAEQPFVDAVMVDLTKRFATTADAKRAGYIQYTDEDETGAINYANREWTSSDDKHPSQLWYDANGRLIGADFSVPYDKDARPTLFDTDPSRWERFGAHVHYGVAGPNGTTTYGAIGPKTLAKVGGVLDHPTARNLVDAKIAPAKKDVRFVFTFPAIWDLSLWLIPNPDGAFADKNPDLKAKNAKPMPM